MSEIQCQNFCAILTSWDFSVIFVFSEKQNRQRHRMERKPVLSVGAVLEQKSVPKDKCLRHASDVPTRSLNRP